MEHKFNENYKKEIILKMAKHLINTDEYKCVAEEDLKDDLLSNKELWLNLFFDVVKNCSNGYTSKELIELFTEDFIEYKDTVSPLLIDSIYKNTNYETLGNISKTYYITKESNLEKALQSYLLDELKLSIEYFDLLDYTKVFEKYFEEKIIIEDYTLLKLKTS